MHQFIQSQTTINNQTVAIFNDIRTHITKLPNVIGSSQQEKGKFSAQPQEKPRGQHVIESSESTKESCEQLKVVTTLRSGKKIDKTIFSKVSPKATLANEKETKGNSEGVSHMKRKKLLNLMCMIVLFRPLFPNI